MLEVVSIGLYLLGCGLAYFHVTDSPQMDVGNLTGSVVGDIMFIVLWPMFVIFWLVMWAIMVIIDRIYYRGL